MPYPTTNLFLESIVKDYSGLVANTEVSTMENAVSGQNDGSANSAGQKAIYRANQAGGHGALEFTSAYDGWYDFGNIMAGRGECHFFLAIKMANDPSLASGDGMTFRYIESSGQLFPHTNGLYYTDYGRDSRISAKSYALDVSTDWNLFEWQVKNNAYRIFINDTLVHEELTSFNYQYETSNWKFGGNTGGTLRAKVLGLLKYSVLQSGSNRDDTLDYFKNTFEMARLGYGANPVPNFTITTPIEAGDNFIPDNTSTGCTSYEWRVNGVLRSTDFEPNLAKWLINGNNSIELKGINGASNDTITKTVIVNTKQITINSPTTQYTKTGLQSGLKLVGRVKAVDDESNESNYTATDEATAT